MVCWMDAVYSGSAGRHETSGARRRSVRAMTTIARHGRMRARRGQGDALAAMLREVAEGLRGTPGCELYLINQAADDHDQVWVTEQWASRETCDAALAAAREAPGPGPTPADVMALVQPGGLEMIELAPLGGVGDGQVPLGHTRMNLEQAQDMAARFGYGELGESRFPTGDLGLAATGFSHHRLRPGRRQAFGHRHRRAEEVYVVLAGSGQIKIDDEVLELGTLDAVRLGPDVVRCLEAGEDGLEVLAFGPRHTGDAEMLPGWWAD
jgi:quinol monooxygenase YgiN/uncharacterized cupin superfamily protein